MSTGFLGNEGEWVCYRCQRQLFWARDGLHHGWVLASAHVFSPHRGGSFVPSRPQSETK